jgi:hypothetical protein
MSRTTPALLRVTVYNRSQSNEARLRYYYKDHLRLGRGDGADVGAGAGAGTGAGGGPQSSPGLIELDVLVPGDPLPNVENDEDPPVIDTHVLPPFEYPVLVLEVSIPVPKSEFPIKAFTGCSSPLSLPKSLSLLVAPLVVTR